VFRFVQEWFLHHVSIWRENFLVQHNDIQGNFWNKIIIPLCTFFLKLFSYIWKSGFEFCLVPFQTTTSFGLLFTSFIGNCRLWQHSCLHHLQRRILRFILKITILLQWEWMIPQYTYIMFVWMRYDKMLVDSPCEFHLENKTRIWSFPFFLQVKSKLMGHSKRIAGLAFSNVLNTLVSSGADAQVGILSLIPCLHYQFYALSSLNPGMLTTFVSVLSVASGHLLVGKG